MHTAQIRLLLPLAPNIVKSHMAKKKKGFTENNQVLKMTSFITLNIHL